MNNLLYAKILNGTADQSGANKEDFRYQQFYPALSQLCDGHSNAPSIDQDVEEIPKWTGCFLTLSNVWRMREAYIMYCRMATIGSSLGAHPPRVSSHVLTDPTKVHPYTGGVERAVNVALTGAEGRLQFSPSEESTRFMPLADCLGTATLQVPFFLDFMTATIPMEAFDLWRNQILDIVAKKPRSRRPSDWTIPFLYGLFVLQLSRTISTPKEYKAVSIQSTRTLHELGFSANALSIGVLPHVKTPITIGVLNRCLTKQW